jgi:hypothetical protein
MRGQVVAWLGLQSVIPFDENQFVADKLYQGTLDLLARTRCVVRCVDLRVRANQDEYTLDHSLLALVDVENGGYRRYRRDQAEIFNDYGAIQPEQWYGPATPIDPQTGFTLIRADVLRVVPIPSVDGIVQVWGVLRPQQMASDTDSPADEAYGAIPEEWHDAIVTYATWKLADYADDGATQNGEYYRVLYEGEDGRGGRLAQIRIGVNKRGTAKGPRMHVRLSSPSGSGAYT